MPLSVNHKSALSQVFEFFKKSEDIFYFSKEIDYSSLRNIGTDVLFLNDFYVSPKKSIIKIDSLNEFFSNVKRSIDLEDFLVKEESQDFRQLTENKLGIARAWYEEIVAIDRIASFEHSRQFLDLSLLKADYEYIKDDKVLLYIDDRVLIRNIKRRTRIFLYPDKDIAKLASDDALNPASLIDIKYLRTNKLN